MKAKLVDLALAVIALAAAAYLGITTGGLR